MQSRSRWGDLIFWALVFWMCGLFGGPFFEDDFFRYLWDGYRFAQDGTPYGIAPEAFFGDPGVPVMFRGILDQINFPELPTIYGPVVPFVFLLGYAVGPGSVAPLQAIFVLADLLAIGLLLRLAPARSVLLYAWCALVVKEIAFTTHPDGFAVCRLFAAVARSRRERLFAAAGLLALSAGAKALALPLVPFVLLRVRFAHWLTFFGVLALLYLPFAWRGGTDLSTLFVFAREWEFNASVFRLWDISSRTRRRGWRSAWPSRALPCGICGSGGPAGGTGSAGTGSTGCYSCCRRW